MCLKNCPYKWERAINQLSMQTFHQIDPAMKYQRGTLAALKTKPENLTPLRLNKRDSYLQQQPAIAAIYDFKQELHQLLTKKHCTAKECKRLLPRFLDMVKELKQSAFQHLRTLGNTLFKWREEVVRMLRFTKNNGITEGFHRKMKLIQRRAYGFRNFENYRLRVRVLCGWVKCPRIWGRPSKVPADLGKTPHLNGALGGTRTPDTLVRSQVLYPAELRAHGVGWYG